MIPKIPPGGQPDTATINRLIEAANRNLRSSVRTAIQNTLAGQALTESRKLEPIWGLLVGAGPDDRPHSYAFVEVYCDPDGQWQLKPHGYYSEPNNDFAPVVINPAIEVNGMKGLELNTIVYLVPAEFLTTDDHGRVWREWYFSGDDEIHAICLLDDLIPTGGGELDFEIRGYFLFDPTKTPYTFYAAHPANWQNPDTDFISLGIGRGPGSYTRGTYGWAKFVDRGTLVRDNQGQPVWRGEWQIVTLYASLHADVRIYGARIDPGETGDAELWWMDKHDGDFALVNSAYQIRVTNSLEAPLLIDERVTVHFDRHDYRWYPTETERWFWAKVQTGGWTNDSGDVPRTFSVKACNWDGTGVVGAAFDVVSPLKPTHDTALFEDYVVAYRVEADETKVICSDCWDLPIGRIVWESVDIADIRDGWRLCDGTAGAPDLTARFIMGVDVGGRADEDQIGDTGGRKIFTVSHQPWGDSAPDAVQNVVDDVDERGAGFGADEVDQRPQYYVMAALQRFE